MTKRKDIPGFYFDEEKGKYFRIQQNHRVVPGMGYTKQSVKEAQRAKQDRQRTQKQIQRQETGKIVRSRLLTISSSPLLARLGVTSRRNRDGNLQQYAAGLSQASILPGAHMPTPGNHIVFGPSGLPRIAAVPRTDIAPNSTANLTPTIDPLPEYDATVDLPFDSFSNMFANSGYNERNVGLMTSLKDANGNEYALVTSTGAGRFAIQPVDAEGNIQPNLWLELSLAARKVEMIWDIAASPSAPYLAMATDVGIIIGHYHNPHNVLINSSLDLSSREQMKVSFKDVNTAMSGERSGRVNLVDVRVGRGVTRLLHSSAVLGTLPLHDSNHVLVHGFSTTSTYDLRWAPQPTLPSRRSALSRPRSSLYSPPYIEFAIPSNRHSDHYTRGRKVAYSADLEFVAAVSSNYPSSNSNELLSQVTLYSARTGRVLDSPLTRHKYPAPVVDIDIRRVRDGPESIFCQYSGYIYEWGHGRLSWDEIQEYGFDYKTLYGSRRASRGTTVGKLWSK